SVMAIRGLEVLEGHKVQVIAHGPDAAQAAKELADALREGLGEEGVAPVSEAEATPSLAPAAWTAPAPRPARGGGRGRGGFNGDMGVKEDAADRHKERRLLNEALDRAMVQLENLESRLRQDADADKAAIFGAPRR